MNTQEPEIPKDIQDLATINSSLKYFRNRKSFYENKEKTFQTYNMAALEAKAAHEIDICAMAIKRLDDRKTKLLTLLN